MLLPHRRVLSTVHIRQPHSLATYSGFTGSDEHCNHNLLHANPEQVPEIQQSEIVKARVNMAKTEHSVEKKFKQTMAGVPQQEKVMVVFV